MTPYEEAEQLMERKEREREEAAARAKRASKALENGQQSEPRLLKKFLTFEQLLTQPPPVWMLDGLFFEQSLVEIYGASNHGKTFIAADVGLSIRRGGSWCGREIYKPGAVCYVNADGGLGFADRARAWQSLHEGERSAFEFYTYPEPISLHRPQEMVEFVAALRYLPECPVFIVFDTYSQCIPGMNENLQDQSSLVVQQLTRMRLEFGATCVLLHHTNVAGDRERGSNVILGACDTQILVEKPEEGRLVVSCKKQRDAPYFKPLHFSLDRIPGTNFVWPVQTDPLPETPHERKLSKRDQMVQIILNEPGVTCEVCADRMEVSDRTARRYAEELIDLRVIVEANLPGGEKGGRAPRGLFPNPGAPVADMR